MEKSEKDQELDGIVGAGISGAAAETVQRYGSAVKEHLVSYSGQDRESGKQLKRGLKKIAAYKLNPDYQEQNIKQQAGFAAEVKDTARVNAEKIIQGTQERKVRTDDLGRVNDPLYDHVEVDAAGVPVPGSGSQMKFVGATPKEALNKLASKDFAKYLEGDAVIEVPSDFYEGILAETRKEIASLQEQLARQRQSGSPETVKALETKLAKYEKIQAKLRPSTVSRAEARFARLHPKLSAAGDITKISHRAGVESAKYGAMVGGSISIVQNLVALVKGEESPEEAAANVALSTGSAAAAGYGTGFAGSAIKGAMQNAGSEYVRALSKTNLPGAAVTVAVLAAKTMKRYFDGEIDGLECFEELGEQGTGMLSSALFATIGQMAIPIPVAGGLIGGMLGYAISSASYSTLMSSLKEAELTREERLWIEAECQRQAELIRTYREEMESVIQAYLLSNEKVFHQAFHNLKEELRIGDVDGFICAANSITEALGGKAAFHSLEEFEALMSGDAPMRF